MSKGAIAPKLVAACKVCHANMMASHVHISWQQELDENEVMHFKQGAGAYPCGYKT